MRKRTSPTILEQAVAVVPEFQNVINKLSSQVTLRGQSKSTLDNYTRRIALFVLHFKQLPEKLSEDEINEYLVALARGPKSPSRSSFKHMVYGLRYYFRLLGMNTKAISLPSLKGDTKLPIILNRSELKELFAAPMLLKQRVVLALIYSAGLRGQEVINLKLSDPAAGFSLKGQWKTLGKNGRYLYPVHQLSAAFKGKFLSSLKRKLRKLDKPDAFASHINKAYKKPWVVCCEPPMAKADHVIKYLGQYTHRLAISNQRILDITDTHVTFIARDYRDRAQKKPLRLKGEEFLRRFAQHVLPKGFVRIRRYGIYHPTTKRNLELEFVPDEKPSIEKLEKAKETSAERILRLTGFDIGLCPCCKKGRMHIKKEIPRIRSPAAYLPSLLFAACL